MLRIEGKGKKYERRDEQERGDENQEIVKDKRQASTRATESEEKMKN